MTWLTDYLDKFTYIGIAVVLFLCGLGVPIPEDVPLIFGGVMAGAGKIDVYVHFAISMIFILVGDSCLYYIGRGLGGATTRSKRFSRVLTPERYAKVVEYFDRYGSWTVFFARFVAGIRGAVFLSAGAARFSYARFVLLDFLAALISVPIWIWLGHTFGENWEAILERAKTTQTWVLVALLAAVVGGYIGWHIFKSRRVRARMVRMRESGSSNRVRDDAQPDNPKEEERQNGQEGSGEARPVRHP